MNGTNGGGDADFEEQSRVAGEVLERSLLRAVSSAESELARVVRSGEAELDRLALRITETLAQLAIDGVLGARPVQADSGAAPASLNGIAKAVARAARRGARFT